MQQEDTATLEVLLKRLGLTTVHKLFSEPRDRKRGWSYGTFLESQRKWRTGLKLALLLKWLGQSFLSLPSRPLTSPSSDFKRQMLVLGPELVSDNRSLILEGPPGTGKTHLCIAIAYKAIQKLCRSFHHCRCSYQRAALEL